MNVYEKLAKIQIALKAPKGQFNSFGKYNYRSCEDILEALKPLLKEQGLVLILSDEIVCIGARYYIKATALLKSINDDNEQIFNTAYAREDENKKGADGAQITGACSSYARKYALNGLFLIDDTKDADTNEYHEQQKKQEAKPAKPIEKPAQTSVNQYVKIENNETYVLTRQGYKKPSELNLSTLQQMYNNKLYHEAQFVIQLAINDKEAEQPA